MSNPVAIAAHLINFFDQIGIFRFEGVGYAKEAALFDRFERFIGGLPQCRVPQGIRFLSHSAGDMLPHNGFKDGE